MYGSEDLGAAVVEHVNDVIGDLDALGHTGVPVILSEWGQGDPNVQPPETRSYSGPEDRRDAIRTVLSQMDIESRWVRSFWYNFNRMHDTMRIIVHGRTNVTRALYEPLCAFARQAGDGSNRHEIDECELRVSIYGDNMIPPNEPCQWEALTEGGSGSFAHTWYKDGIAVWPGDTYTYTATNGEEFELQVETFDGRDTAWSDTFSVHAEIGTAC